jgi:EamA domain-containing membrane protein RarD
VKLLKVLTILLGVITIPLSTVVGIYFAKEDLRFIPALALQSAIAGIDVWIWLKLHERGFN